MPRRRGHFGVTRAAANCIVSEVYGAVRTWRAVAAAFGLSRAETERMATAFEHTDAELATSLS